MSVQIHISGDNAAEAIKELSGLAAHFVAAPGAVAVNADTQSEDKPKRQRSSKPQEESSQKQQEESDQKQEQEKTESDAGNGEGTEKAPTVVELRAKAQEVGKTTEAKKAIKALLD